MVAQRRTEINNGAAIESRYRWLRPLAAAADDFANQARTLGTGERIYTGIAAFDQAMRGLAPRELMIVQGYAHSGKTLFVTEMLRHNKGRRIVMFTADEDRVLVLVKLTSLEHGVSAEELEYRIANGDTTAEELVRSTATEHFPNLVVFDDVAELRRMTEALQECQDYWGAPADLVVFDYVGLLQNGDGEAGAVVGKIDAIKSWGKEQGVPLVAMHQSSRTKGTEGAEVTIDSGTHGGEQQATFVVGVRRKRDQYRAMIRDLEQRLNTQVNPSPRLDDLLAEARYDLARHQDTITFNLVKNKRPPSRLVDDTDFRLDADTGRIAPVDMAFSSTSEVDETFTPTVKYGLAAAQQQLPVEQEL